MLFNTKISGLLASCRIAFLLVALSGAPAHAIGEGTLKAASPNSLPPLPYTDEKGQKQNVTASNHKLTAVHFWATWCVPCVAELPEVDKTLQEYADKGFQVIALSVDSVSHMDKVKQFYSDHKIAALKPVIDGDMVSFQAAKVRGLPTTLFLNADGKEIARAEGALEWGIPSTRDFIESHLK